MTRPSRFLRRIFLSILMPFALLLAQQGGLLHELGHFEAAVASASVQTHASAADADSFCLACLSYAQVAGLAKPEPVAAPAAATLRFHFASALRVAVAETAALAPRSRGPPLFL